MSDEDDPLKGIELPAHLKAIAATQLNDGSVPALVGGVGPSKVPTLVDPIELDRDGERITVARGFLDVRQSEHLPPGYKARPVGTMSFDPRLAYEIALDIEDPVTVFARYNYEEDAAVALLNDSVFKKTVANYRNEIQTSGISFKLKAKIQAEDLLTHSYQLATDPDVPAAVRADMIKWTAKMAGHEPSTKESGGGGGGTFALNITFAQGGQTVLSATPQQRSVAVIDAEQGGYDDGDEE